jgi:uncharacterized RDD family membrane protein YckC
MQPRIGICSVAVAMLNLDRRLKGLLAGEAERTIDAALASRLVEAVARSVSEHHVPERIGTDAAEQTVAMILQSPAVRQAAAELIASDEVRRGLRAGAGGFGAEVAQSLQERLAALDARTHRAASSPFAGFGIRTTAFVLDLVLVQAAVVIGGGSVWLLLSLVGAGRPGIAGSLIGGVAWLLAVAVYFVCLWTVAGQTFGMRVFGLRVATTDGAPPSIGRSVLRFAGLVALPLGTLLMLVDSRRRGLQDVIAGTLVAQSSAWMTNAVANPSVVTTPTSFPP